MWMEQLESRRLMSGTAALERMAPEADLRVSQAAVAAAPKLPKSFTGSMTWKNGKDNLVLTITKQTPSANGRWLWLTGSLLQVDIGESFAVSARVDLRTRAVTGTSRGIAAGTLAGTFGTDWSSASGQFTSTQAGKTTKGSFQLAKAKALPYDLRGTYKGQTEQGDSVSLTIAKQSAAGVVWGTAASGETRFDVLGLVDNSGTGYLYLRGDGRGTFYGYFESGGWRSLRGHLTAALNGRSFTLYCSLRRR